MTAVCLTIAGFDNGGGAGIQADLKTFAATKSYGLSVLTALPVQNTLGVGTIYDMSAQCVKEQLETVFADVMPQAIKIGMLANAAIIDTVATFLGKHAANIPIILDPVMIAKSGDYLLAPEALDAFKEQLLPLANLITPNLPEAQSLVGRRLSFADMAEYIKKLGPKAVLLKGGHDADKQYANDLFVSDTNIQWLKAPRIQTRNNHGTGCTLSAAITSFIAQGDSLFSACCKAKEYLYQALLGAVDDSVGQGHGPVKHFYFID